jgi:hypothetical protein
MRIDAGKSAVADRLSTVRVETPSNRATSAADSTSAPVGSLVFMVCVQKSSTGHSVHGWDDIATPIEKLRPQLSLNWKHLCLWFRVLFYMEMNNERFVF